MSLITRFKNRKFQRKSKYTRNRLDFIMTFPYIHMCFVLPRDTFFFFFFFGFGFCSFLLFRFVFLFLFFFAIANLLITRRKEKENKREIQKVKSIDAPSLVPWIISWSWFLSSSGGDGSNNSKKDYFLIPRLYSREVCTWDYPL